MVLGLIPVRPKRLTKLNGPRLYPEVQHAFIVLFAWCRTNDSGTRTFPANPKLNPEGHHPFYFPSEMRFASALIHSLA